MPEGPEVRRVVEKLRSRLRGNYLLSLSWIINKKKYDTYLESVWPQVKDLFPSVCLDILCRGKQIFYFFANGISFISTLGMEGHWYYFSPVPPESYTGYPKICLYFGEVKERYGITWHISNTEIWYDDMLNYGNFTITNWSGAVSKMRTIGPDLLSTTCPFDNIPQSVLDILPPEFTQYATLDMFKQSLRATSRGHMHICKFLMEQSYFSGCGNYLRSEILYRSRLHPLRTLSSLTDIQMDTLFNVCLLTIKEAYEHGGLTHGTFLDPDMEKGTFPIYVYKREDDKDPNGYIIKRIKVENNRSVFMVDEIQK